MIFLIIQFNFRDIVVAVFQVQNHFCIEMKTRWRLIFKLTTPPEIHALTGTNLVGNHKG